MYYTSAHQGLSCLKMFRVYIHASGPIFFLTTTFGAIFLGSKNEHGYCYSCY